LLSGSKLLDGPRIARPDFPPYSARRVWCSGGKVLPRSLLAQQRPALALNDCDAFDLKPLVRIISASLFILRQLFIRAVEQFRTRPDEAKLKSNDTGQHQNREKLLLDKHEKCERSTRYQRQDYSKTYSFREVASHRSPGSVEGGSVLGVDTEMTPEKVRPQGRDQRGNNAP